MSVLFGVALIVIAAAFWNYRSRTKKTIDQLSVRVEAEKRNVRELAVLNDISSLLYKDLDEMSTIETIVDKSKDLIKAEASALLLLKDNKVAGLYTSIGNMPDLMDQPAGIFSRVMSEGMPLRLSGLKDKEDLPWLKGLTDSQSLSIRNLLIVPLILRDEIIGEIALINRTGGGEFTDDDEDLLLTLGFHSSFALEKARMHQEAMKLATTDGLTGLNNHRTFQERLEVEIARSKRFDHKLSLLMIDIDYFKKFNDNYGHCVGDEVLRRVACLLAESTRNIDFAARYGGEEFVLILPETTNEGAILTAERIRGAIAKRKMSIDGKDLSVTVSIGAASFPEDATDREMLIERADNALYSAKKSGRNRVVAYKDIVADY
ncbi:MAG: sensor domain-containing diguanylate cyclase [Nitrospirota bacterium]